MPIGELIEVKYQIRKVDETGIIPKDTIQTVIEYRAGKPYQATYLGKCVGNFSQIRTGSESNPERLQKLIALLTPQ